MKVRSEIDASNEKLGYRLRQAVVAKIPYTLVLGDKEKENGTVTYRVYGQKDQITVSLEEFKALLAHSIANKLRY